MRYVFIKTLTAQAKKNKNIILLTADLGYTIFESFQEQLPKQYVNVGVAEANMIGIAAGLALSGKIVFAYSIATFATMRCYEQIRDDVAIHNLPVTIVGSGAGLSYSDAGFTHHATEDIAIMRPLPNMTILCPADPLEAKWATRAAIDRKGPMYLRLAKRGEPVLHKQNERFTLGKGTIMQAGRKIAVLATGNIVANAHEAVVSLKSQGITCTLVSMHSIKPLDKTFILKLAESHTSFVTVEEHAITGGLGSCVAEILAENASNTKLYRLGIDEKRFFQVGDHEYMRSLYGLTVRQIAARIKNIYKHD